MVMQAELPVRQARFPRALSLWLVLAIAAIAAALLGMFISLQTAGARPDPDRSDVAGLPVWAAGLNQGVASSWLKVQKRFGLRDATIGRALDLLKSNARYSMGNPLHDLTGYPEQANRAFALVAGVPGMAPGNLGALKDELRTKLLASRRFPDESVGTDIISGDGSFENLVVFAIVELLYTGGEDPRARELVTSLGTGHRLFK